LASLSWSTKGVGTAWQVEATSKGNSRDKRIFNYINVPRFLLALLTDISVDCSVTPAIPTLPLSNYETHISSSSGATPHNNDEKPASLREAGLKTAPRVASVGAKLGTPEGTFVDAKLGALVGAVGAKLGALVGAWVGA